MKRKLDSGPEELDEGSSERALASGIMVSHSISASAAMTAMAVVAAAAGTHALLVYRSMGEPKQIDGL